METHDPSARATTAETRLSLDALDPLAMPPGTTLDRTAVLPRVEMSGDEPRLIIEGRRRYEVTGRLGLGGLGEVLLAKDNDIGRPVALKKLRSEVRSAAAMARFVEEIRTVGRLEHPGIVPIHDVGVDDAGQYYFVMKYVEGENLESVITHLASGDPEYHRRYGFERRVEIFTGLLDAVAFAHAKGVIHRDIKPANVMVGPYGEVVLMDWGIARAPLNGGSGGEPRTVQADAGEAISDQERRSFRTQAGHLIGTPLYMSPEQARGEPADERSDIYSLCVLFHEFLTLQHYLAGRRDPADVLRGVLEIDPPFAGHVKSPHQSSPPTDLSWFVHAGLQKDSEMRYSSVAAMRERLAKRAEGIVPIECQITLVKRATGEWLRFLDHRPIRAFVLLNLLILLFVGLTIFLIVHIV